MLRFLVFIPLALAFASCAHPGPYKRGYQTFSYTVRGQTYHPMDVEEALYHNEVGIASWYNESSWLGLKRGNTSLGEKVMPWHIIAAHKTLPLPAKVRVTNLENGKDVVCRVNDRGPFIGDRIIDLSPRAARKLGFIDDGLTMVEVEVLSVGDGKHKRKRKKKWFFGLF
ncbi:MAG: septal ring lytic transglycosylase RlpA family protein [Haloferula sp.]